MDLDWGPLSNLPIEIQNKLQNKLRSISLSPGEQLNHKDELPPGIIHIKTGQLRLLAFDQVNKMMTIDIYRENEIAGIEQLLRGVAGEVLAASTHLEGLLLPANEFLRIISQNHQIIYSYTKLNPSELYIATSLNKNPKINKGKGLLNLARQECKDPKEIKLLFPGQHELLVDSSHWLISSGNIKNRLPGEVISSSTSLEILGELPARLIPVSKNWSNHSLTNSSQVKKLDSNFPDEQIQKEALEDWYGTVQKSEIFPYSKGVGTIEGSLACLRMLARFYDLPFRREVLKSVLNDQLARSSSHQLNLQNYAAIIDLIGLRSIFLKPSSIEQIERLPFPCLAIFNQRPILIWDEKPGSVFVSDPEKGQNWQNTKELIQEQSIEIISIESTPNTSKARFGLSWFIPAIKKYRNNLIQVVIASFFVQLLALFNPLLIQQIIDAVISQGNLSSLNVLGVLLVAMALAQALLGSLRTYLFSDTTNRIDISLGSTIIHHLLRLPLGYFSKRPVGEVSSRIGELEKIRRFLTGTALTVLLDAVFSIIYIGVMLLYSVQLTIWALGVLPFFILLTIGAAPIIRRQLREQAIANAQVQSHLVETLSGIETVKGQGMELPSEWRWQQLYSGQIFAGFRNTITSTAAGSASQFLEQISGLLVIWIGAILVLKGQMTLGQLIAFRILSGYVTSPLLRLASLWQNFQETSLSLERLSDIVDQPEEIEIAGEDLPLLPTIQGSICYQQVSFRFLENGPLQLLNISFNIQKGEFVGIVGSSGSGKSTLLKILTRLYDPTEGIIKIDGFDISKVNLYSLRSQIGVVPQDSLLFDGSIQANIALARPDATFEEIRFASKIACADEFIQELSSGYNTSVGERGSNLSGGQRQRIAIARMILKKPKLLILDEATSALDVETEQKLTKNLFDLYKDNTVLFITHRLSNLKNADKILVIHEGVLVEEGSYNELIELNGRFAVLCKHRDS